LTNPSHSCRIEGESSPLTLRLSGEWRLGALAALSAELGQAGLDRLASAECVALDGERLDEIDTAAALLVLSRLEQAGVDTRSVLLDALDPRHRRIVELVRERMAQAVKRAPRRRVGLAGAVGRFALEMWRLTVTHMGFLGITLVALLRALIWPPRLRLRELFAQLSQTCVTAIPVVALVMFLIGVVVAYLLGLQAAQYGANIFVVDGVALGMVREFSPLLVATIVAGRSGAAFTAQLGTMKLTEELDAIRTLGLPPEQVLIVPRVLALAIGLPVLVFVGSVSGLAGAAVVCSVMLDITPSTFLERLQDALDVSHYLIGLAKSPVFALFIAVIGCSMGLTVSRDTRSIGINTTSTVVQSIVVVILLDAFAAVIFQELGW
jgi:phospholipid/cholesterol/gamma-HCH transport system permease protein